MATSDLDLLPPERMNKFDQLIERLYEFYFGNRKGQYLVYALTFLVSVAYASIGILVLGRTEQSVVFDCVILALVFLVGVPVSYNLGVVYADEERNSTLTKIVVEEGRSEWK